MSRLLITGATGRLGSNLMRQAAEPYDVTGWAHSSPRALTGGKMCCVDLTDHALTLKYLRELRLEVPEVIVHCAAMTDVDRCQREPALARSVNVDATETVAQWAAQHGVYFVFLSTDSVFDGRRGRYSEMDVPAPVNEYARTKLAAEEAVHLCNPDALILRTNFYGWSFNEKPSLGEWMLEKLARREQLRAFADVRFNPLLVNDLAEIILALIARRPSGVFHVAAGSDCSKYEFALLLAETFGIDSGTVSPICVQEIAFDAPRPKNTTLAVDKVARFLNIDLPPVEESLRAFKELLDTGYVAALKKKQPDWLEELATR